MTRIVGATVVATGVNSAPSTATIGSTKTIFIDIPVTAPTDTNGIFTMSLVRSATFTQAGNNKYRIRVYYDGEKSFEIPKLTIPPTGNLDITDSLATRLGQ